MTATAARIQIERPSHIAPILYSTGPTALAVAADITITIDGRTYAFEENAPVDLGDLAPGTDYAVAINAEGNLYAVAVTEVNPITAGHFAGFHFAPASHAEGRAGGAAIPAINPFSIWDIGYRPAAPDPRGMAIIGQDSDKPFWADIYLLGTEHDKNGTSRFGVVIADGRDLPNISNGTGRHARLDYAAAEAIYRHHGKRLLATEEFFAAALGVKERCSRNDEPMTAGELTDDAARFISQWGLFDITGTMWQWGTDGHPDVPRPSIFGGSWNSGGDAGSRYAYLGDWPDSSSGDLSARGASDHLAPA